MSTAFWVSLDKTYIHPYCNLGDTDKDPLPAHIEYYKELDEDCVVITDKSGNQFIIHALSCNVCIEDCVRWIKLEDQDWAEKNVKFAKYPDWSAKLLERLWFIDVGIDLCHIKFMDWIRINGELYLWLVYNNGRKVKVPAKDVILRSTVLF